MRANPYRGEVVLWVAGLAPDAPPDEPRPYVLRLDYAALASLRGGEGKEDGFAPDVLLRRALGEDVEAIVTLLHAALRARHPDVTREAIMAASPALFPTVSAIARAFDLALKGPNGLAPEEAAEEHNRPPETAAAGTRDGSRTTSRRRFWPLGRWASAWTSGGA